MDACITAPAKIILFGKHAVVYGCPSITASINLRTRLYLTKDDSKTHSSNLAYILDLNDLCNSPVFILHTYLHNMHVNDSHLIQYVSSQSQTIIGKVNSQMIDSLAVFLLLEELIHRRFPKTVCPVRHTVYRIKINSDIPIGAGLDSSAALCTVIASCLLILHGQITSTKTENNLSLIQSFAHEAEKIFHVKPLGVDTTISTQGDILLFQNQPKNIKRLCEPTNGKNRILIIDTHVFRSTKVVVDEVAEFRAKQPDLCNRIFNDIEALCRDAVDQLALGHRCFDNLFVQNQELLKELGVSHPILDEIAACLLEKAGVGCKLTGAGKGGCAIALPNEEESARLVELLNQLNFRTIKTEYCIPGDQIEIKSNAMNHVL